MADGERAPVTLAVPGEHMVPNALAAVAVGRILGVPLEDVRARRSAPATVSRWRMETFTTADGVRVVNDAYNANPESMAAALKAARWMARDARLIAVLGHMAELGPIAGEEHERLGELAARLARRPGGDGRRRCAEPIAVAAVREGVEPENVAAYDEPPRTPSPTCAPTRDRATSCCSRGRAWPGSNGSRRRCGDLDPGRRARSASP